MQPGGGSGIRTHVGVTQTCFQDMRLQPLGHPSRRKRFYHITFPSHLHLRAAVCERHLLSLPRYSFGVPKKQSPCNDMFTDIININGTTNKLRCHHHWRRNCRSHRRSSPRRTRIKPLILEADERVGGRLSGKEEIKIKDWNFPSEHGVHGIWSSYVNLRHMLKRHEVVSQYISARDEQWIYRVGNSVRRAPIGKVIRNSIIPAPFHYIQLFFSRNFWGMLTLRDLFRFSMFGLCW